MGGRRPARSLASSGPARILWYGASLAFFFAFVLVPPAYVLAYVVTGWDSVWRTLGDPEIGGVVADAVSLSFQVATVVTAADLAFGIPLAWGLTRREFRGKRIVNTLIDIPMAVPTSARGLSVALFWLAAADLTDPLLGLSALQVAITLPYMVRSVSSALEEVDLSYEVAARTLGAVPLTAARTVTLPLVRSGVVAGSVLCFAQALSETGGATVFLSVIGATRKSASVLIGHWKSQMAADPSLTPTLLPAAAFLSLAMMGSSLALLYALKELGLRLRLPEGRVFRGLEGRLSSSPFPELRDLVSGAFALATLVIPSFYVAATAAGGAYPPGFWESVASSFLVASAATALDLAMGLPMAILVARVAPGPLARVLDTLVDVPLLIPTAALGFSLGLFWTRIAPWAPGVVLVWLAHVSFTYSLVVRNAVAALQSLDPGLEGAARTLGADGLTTFREVVFPLIKPSLAAGAVLAFMRSLNETGATLAVYPGAITAPVFIVSLVKAGRMELAGLATLMLAGVSFAVVYLLRRAAGRG